MMDAMSAKLRQERSESQMTLGRLIDLLSSLDPESKMEGMCHPHSYRGYYDDLAFERCEDMPVGKVLEMANCCMGEIFRGYKGGDFQMGRNTPLWIATYGNCGAKLVGVVGDGRLLTKRDE